MPHDLYRKAGVDIDAAMSNVERIKLLAARTYNENVLAGIGGFAGAYKLPGISGKSLVLCAGADGVGTKVKIAQLLNKHDTVGIDLVAMNADDVLCSGARPLFFLDYIAVGKLNQDVISELIKGISEGCLRAGVVLLGGETAQMPDLYGPDEYDLAGFCVGACEEEQFFNSNAIKPGDVLVGLKSSGLHSNGYTLARRVLLEQAGLKLDSFIPELGRTLGEELLEPTAIYSRVVLEVRNIVPIKGLAHITGGGLVDNVPRILPNGLGISLSCNWEVPPIFTLVEKLGNVSRDEMYRVFNMGVGMVAVVEEDKVDAAMREFSSRGCESFVVGEVVAK